LQQNAGELHRKNLIASQQSPIYVSSCDEVPGITRRREAAKPRSREVLVRVLQFLPQVWPIYLYEAHHLFFIAGTVKETIAPICEETEVDIKVLLKGTDVAWAQYKRCHGTQVTSTKELDEFLDRL
jgi:hypothetical protein